VTSDLIVLASAAEPRHMIVATRPDSAVLSDAIRRCMAAMNEWSPPVIDGVSLRTRAPSDVIPCDCGIRIGKAINRIRRPDRFDGRSLCGEIASGSCGRDVVQIDMLKLKARLTLARNCYKLKAPRSSQLYFTR